MAQRVDYIIIDASPVLELDDLFVEIADKIVIPTFLDEVTTQGIFNLIKKVGVTKIKAIMPNRSHSTKLENDYYTELQSAFEDMSVVLTCPIKHSSAVAKLIDAGRTLWETKQKSLDPVRSEFQKIAGGGKIMSKAIFADIKNLVQEKTYKSKFDFEKYGISEKDKKFIIEREEIILDNAKNTPSHFMKYAKLSTK